MHRVAVGDIGTNTARLLVADVDDGVVNEIELETLVVGLGRGLHATGVLQDDAIERAVKGLAGFRRHFAEADHAIIVATSASRDAANRDDFFDQVEQQAGVRPTLISGDQEAAYAFAGASQALPGKRITVIDIGGGSTEFITGQTTIEDAVSIDIGSVRLTDLHLGQGPISSQILSQARETAARALPNVNPNPWATVVGVAGTITTVSAALLGLAAYDRSLVHLSTIRLANVTRLITRMAEFTTQEISQYATIGTKRAPVILGGLVILEAAMQRLECVELIVSERDLLHGVAATL